MGPRTLLSALFYALLITLGGTEFIAPTVTLRNARRGDDYFHDISGLVIGSGLRFSKDSSGSDWLSISPDGVLSGTPGKNDDQTVVTIRVSGGQGVSNTARFTIPVRPAGSVLVPELNVLTFNLWHGGTQVTNWHDKQVRFLVGSAADVVGIQEDQSGNHAIRLANALGWYCWTSEGDTSIISKYPIAEKYGIIVSPDRVGGVRIELDGERQQINFYVAHLGHDPYGPYDFCFDHMTKDQVMKREVESGRKPQIETALASMDSRLKKADEIPVLFVGDFNAPSHLDWTEELKEKNCGISNVDWPTSVLPASYGLIDSFRVANPDPAKDQGLTWSPVFLWNSGRNAKEPLDRIDFIYHKGKALKVVGSRRLIVGDPKPIPDHKDNEWTSDHYAVLTSYEFK